MLDDYQKIQPLAYNIMKNEIQSGHLSHAYLIDENNYVNTYDMVLAFVVSILSLGLSEREVSILKKRIYENNYPELKIIEPDGMLIKKRQILDLQHDFSMSAVEGNKRIYIIRNADKMRSETANSMLKFLEEPNSSIIAILLTNNYNVMLSTIISRCQVIKMSNNNDYVDSEYLDLAINFVSEVENNGIKTILKVQELIFDNISVKDREKLLVFFDKIIDIYYDILKLCLGEKKIKYINYVDVLANIASENDQNKLLNKLNYLTMKKESIKYNVNNSLLFDSLIVNLGGNYEGSWS